jgi:lysophospholipase L1-like esterase
MFGHLGMKRLASMAIGAMGILALFLTGSGSAGAEDQGRSLALGDSVVFGFITQAGFEYGNPNNFIGYPDYVGRSLRLNTTNASCPGEATGRFILLTSLDDNGCQGFRSHFPLHVSYSTSQLDFATSFLAAHHNTRLVTIGLGANDLFILQKACLGVLSCIQAGLPAVLASIGANMHTILHALRTAHFHGVLMVVNYYSLDYSDNVGTGLTMALNKAITDPAAADKAVVADEFTAFMKASAGAGGNTCMAGLLNASPQNQLVCDVHPSQSGQQLLATTVENAYEAAISD